MDGGISFGTLVISWRVGRRKDHYRSVSAPFTCPKMFQNLISVPLWKVHVQ